MFGKMCILKHVTSGHLEAKWRRERRKGLHRRRGCLLQGPIFYPEQMFGIMTDTCIRQGGENKNERRASSLVCWPGCSRPLQMCLEERLRNLRRLSLHRSCTGPWSSKPGLSRASGYRQSLEVLDRWNCSALCCFLP